MRTRTPGAFAIGVLLLPITTFAQAPARDRSTAEAPAGTARLRGRVVAADTGTPIRRAQVRAVASAVRVTRLANTDAEGRYEFANLPAGRYTVTVSKAGYVGLEFGQHRPFEGGRPLEIADGQVAESIDFSLPRGSVIGGRITDEAGDPIVGASVYAMRYQYADGGRRRLLPVESASWMANLTNDLGEFRLFGLMPGTYLVVAQSQSASVVSLTQTGSQTGGISSVEARDGFLQTYFPGTANVAEARQVLVNLSEEADASFALVTGRMSKLSGIVRRSDGRAAASLDVTIRPRDADGTDTSGWGTTASAADGSFNFANVPPGQYLLEVAPRRQSYDLDSGTVMRQGSDPAQAPEFARVPMTVGGGDLTGILVTTRPGITVSGRVFIQGAASKYRNGLRITARSADQYDDDRAFSFTSENGRIDESGRFLIRNVNGQVIFRPFPIAGNFVLNSVSLNGVDITDRPYDASNGDLGGVEIAIADEAQVNGTAKNARGEPVRDFRVALFPATGKPSTLTRRFMHTGSADINGRFHISRLPAGEYLGIAVRSFERGQEWDPSFQQRFLPSARRFTIKEGQTLTVELPYVE